MHLMGWFHTRRQRLSRGDGLRNFDRRRCGLTGGSGSLRNSLSRSYTRLTTLLAKESYSNACASLVTITQHIVVVFFLSSSAFAGSRAIVMILCFSNSDGQLAPIATWTVDRFKPLAVL